MDFVGGFLRIRKGHDYLFVVVDRFCKMYILMPCKKTFKGQDETNMFIEKVWVHFGIQRENMDTRILEGRCVEQQ